MLMKRALIVGLVAAAVTLLLVSFSTFLELRYTDFGKIMREMTARKPQHTFNQTMTVMARWVRIQSFVVDPIISLFVGFLVGLFSTKRYLAALAIALLPILVVNVATLDLTLIAAAALCAATGLCSAKLGCGMGSRLWPFPQTRSQA
jgi:hypothetical protein